MSYDLYFISRNRVFHPETFIEYFRAREHYQIETPQFFYENKDTDVYFTFEFDDPPEGAQDEYIPVTLNVNYFRPSYFILEVEPEVTAFVRHFDVEGQGTSGSRVSRVEDVRHDLIAEIERRPRNSRLRRRRRPPPYWATRRTRSQRPRCNRRKAG